MLLHEVAAALGVALPDPGGKCRCPFQDHKRKDKTFRVFVSQSGDELWKCWSCDPPDNVGDAVAFYARYCGVDRREAWKRVKNLGHSMPGRGAHRPDHRPQNLLRGPLQGPYLKLDPASWRSLASSPTDAVVAFGARRGIDPAVLLDNDVVAVGSDAVGFGYRDPDTLLVCRVKVRTLERKTFWVEPKDPEHKLKAKAPLYLSHALVPRRRAPVSPVVIVEGELDALSLKQVGINSVVSLPDGAASAAQVDLLPLENFSPWLIATDDDEEGARAAGILRDRARSSNVDSVRVFWRKLVVEGEREELARHKDANDALRAGFVREDFGHCVQVAAEAALEREVAI